MTRVTFLFGAQDRLATAAQWLAQRPVTDGNVLVLSPDEDLLSTFDQLLWTHSATGFTPHCRAASPLAAETPILLARSSGESSHGECLINLGNAIPEDFARFQELVEVISVDETERTAGRERFRFYRNNDCPVESIDVSRGLSDER